jgi:hypothetical protein
VTDSRSPVAERAVGEVVDENLELSGALAGAEVALGVDDGDPRGVVTPVLEALEAAEEDLETLVVSDITHNSAHGSQF